jgi:hypothetical protein
MAESKGGQARTWSRGKGGRRMVSRGAAQRATTAPALGGNRENGRWADWAGPGGLRGGKMEKGRVGQDVAWR